MRSLKFRPRAALAFLVFCAPCPLAFAQTIDDARRVTSEYSRHVVAADVDAVVAGTNHVLVDDLGGKEKAKAWLADQYRRLQSLDQLPIAEQIDRIREYHDEKIDLFFVETTRSFDAFPKPVQSTYLYLVDTTDKGKTWEVLDLVCVDLKWLHQIAPSFKDDSSVGDILPH